MAGMAQLIIIIVVITTPSLTGGRCAGAHAHAAGAMWLIVVVITSIDFTSCIWAHGMQLMTNLVDCSSLCWTGAHMSNAADMVQLVMFVALANSRHLSWDGGMDSVGTT